jgi:hypothetical protein
MFRPFLGFFNSLKRFQFFLSNEYFFSLNKLFEFFFFFNETFVLNTFLVLSITVPNKPLMQSDTNNVCLFLNIIIALLNLGNQKKKTMVRTIS